ncbi:MFS general substrate transporter [Lentithecium fluviatile CBS 122367]|uniref:MFS general substrate transporter n=1 Tax=Lentithecium fluviatile CBS 122367 TaxID=1168545 RepID=A0A6G1JER0_9PLEO|nr:MFS general substrate transporter [Lentithecium fluviatile CBS 122367]
MAEPAPSRKSDEAGEAEETTIENLEIENSEKNENENGPSISSSSKRMQMSGWRLQALSLALCLSLFLSMLDSTIVATALIPITNDLNGFDQISWVMNGYLVTYTGFLVITAKLSDIVGRRAIVATSLVIFIAFSIACGVAQTLTQLIVFRALQGIGGGGLYTMVFVILPEMCTPEQYTLYSTIISSVSVVSSLLGPILGGVISEKTTWRWIFWINVPISAVAMGLLYLSIPAHFPYAKPIDAPKLSRAALRKLDLVGTCLLLAATTLLLTALEESSVGKSWSSAIVLAPLVTGLFFWVCFFGWSKVQTLRSTVWEPILPWRVLTDRFCLALFTSTFWVGAILYAAVVALPQRFQIVHNTSATQAGLRLLPITMGIPVGSAIAASMMQKRNVPPMLLILTGAAIETVGIALTITLPTDASAFPNKGYGFEAITGFGLGMSTAIAVLSAMLVFKPEDLSVGMGGLGQFRSLGGCIGVAVVSNLMNRYFTDNLSSELSRQQMAAIKLSADAIEGFPEALQTAIRETCARGYTRQGIAMTAFGSAAVLTTFLMAEKKLRRQRPT